MSNNNNFWTELNRTLACAVTSVCKAKANGRRMASLTMSDRWHEQQQQLLDRAKSYPRLCGDICIQTGGMSNNNNFWTELNRTLACAVTSVCKAKANGRRMAS
ncbi:hypothetical protein TNCV_227621 [Trichonephila clavipes]|nr:hypothetical protein TNCV_227621 [Trichonephila clavipes]